MSGGAFNYTFYKVHEFAAELEWLIAENKDPENGYQFSEDTIMKLKQIARDAERMAHRMRDVEWLYSGDIGEDDFLKG